MSADTRSRSDPLSPELALVDPELAAKARRELQQDGTPRRDNGRADAATPRPRAASRPTPHAVYIPRPERTLPPSPPPAAPPVLPARRRAPRWSQRRRRRLSFVVAYALVGVLAFLIARHELHGTTAAETSASPGADAQAPGPTRNEPKIPTAIAHTQRARTFVWVDVKGVSFYEVRIFRKDREIFEARTAQARLSLPQTWHYGGRTYRLQPGTYRWLVLPGFGERSQPRYGAPVVSATLRISR